MTYDTCFGKQRIVAEAAATRETGRDEGRRCRGPGARRRRNGLLDDKIGEEESEFHVHSSTGGV